MRNLFLFFSLIACLNAWCVDDVALTMRNFYADLNKGDSIDLVGYFHPECHVKHVADKEVWDLDLPEFLKVCPKFKSDYFSEEIVRMQVHEFESGFTYVDVYFDFYIKGAYSHSGLDHFCLTRRGGLQKIESVYSSDFTDGFPKKDDKSTMDSYMNDWHKNAAIANEQGYFEFMDSDFIYLGTDPDERWTKKDFLTYCKPYFDKKSTWNFTTNWRNWYFSEDQSIAWFEESLDTQMEDCRGSGVLKKVDGDWKITHYNLSVVIENEKMKKFIRLRRKK